MAAALERIGDRRNRLCVFASPELDQLRPLLPGLNHWIHAIPSQPLPHLPQLLSAADVACVLQDASSETARWQMPAKISDALAMGVPCLATATAPLLPLIEEGGLIAVEERDLADKLAAMLADAGARAEQARRGRELFLKSLSYAAVRPRLSSVLREAAASGSEPHADLVAAVSFQRSTFVAPSTEAHVEPAPKPPSVVPGPSTHQRSLPRTRRSEDGGIDIAMFWRQNDSGIYGRRQDMFLKYLSASPKVRRIVHFDDAISVSALLGRWKEGRTDPYSQSSLVAKQTLRRLRGYHPHPKVSAHTFVYQGGPREPGAALRHVVPPRSQYAAYVGDVLGRNGFGARPIVFWAFPRHYDFPGFVDCFRPDLVVADVVDDTRSWSTGQQRERLTKNYAAILGMSDLVVANCQAVAPFCQGDVRRPR